MKLLKAVMALPAIGVHGVKEAWKIASDIVDPLVDPIIEYREKLKKEEDKK